MTQKNARKGLGNLRFKNIDPETLKRFDFKAERLLLKPESLKGDIFISPKIKMDLTRICDPKNDSLVKALQADERGRTLSRSEKREVMGAIGKVKASNPITKVLLAKIAQAESLPKRIRQAAQKRLAE